MYFARRAGKVLGIEISSLELTENEHKGLFHYVFSFPGYERRDKLALEIGETFLLALTFSAGPFIEEDFSPSVFRIPNSLILSRKPIERGRLLELDRSRPYNEQTLPSVLTIQGSSIVSPLHYEYAWNIVPRLLLNETLHRVVRYMVSSQYNFYIYPGVIQEVLDQPNTIPETSIDKNRYEVALHNAFKAVEAVIGDPPKDDSKFFARLRAIGLDPNELVGYGQKQPLAQVIREMSEARDKKSAHGSTPKKEITVGELTEYQACADYIVCVALDVELKNKREA